MWLGGPRSYRTWDPFFLTWPNSGTSHGTATTDIGIGDKNKYKKPEEEIEPEVGDNEDSLICRKSKRMRHLPPQLINDYQCGPVIVKHAREEQLFGSTDYDYSEICQKYMRLKILLKKEWY